MYKCLLAVALASLVGCMQYAVTDVHGDVQVKCALTAGGRITDDCHEESTDAESVLYESAADAAAEQQPDQNPNDAVVANGLARLAPRPVPTTADVARVLTSTDAQGKLNACRAVYGADVDHVTAQLKIAPSGTIAKVALFDAKDQLGACVARVLHETRLPAFGGDHSVVMKQTIALLACRYRRAQTMIDLSNAGTFVMGSHTVKRIGYGAMQLAGPGVFGPPKDHGAALAVLREAVASGIDHIDTSDFYGPHITNQLIREALHP